VFHRGTLPRTDIAFMLQLKTIAQCAIAFGRNIPPNITSLAVLPLEKLGLGVPAQEYFSRRLRTEEVIAAVGHASPRLEGDSRRGTWCCPTRVRASPCRDLQRDMRVDRNCRKVPGAGFRPRKRPNHRSVDYAPDDRHLWFRKIRARKLFDILQINRTR